MVHPLRETAAISGVADVERGVVDLVGVMGYYHFVSMILNVDRYPLPAGTKAELQALK